MREKEMYIVFHEPNDMYEIETETRQELLTLATEYFTDILTRFTSHKELELVIEKYPRWMENIFTRNTNVSNMEYMEFMTLSHVWSMNQWDSLPFNLFCQKLHMQLSMLLVACEITPCGLAEFALMVQDASQGNLYNISEIGYKFGHTIDDDGSF